jgi:hypothetical protein
MQGKNGNWDAALGVARPSHGRYPSIGASFIWLLDSQWRILNKAKRQGSFEFFLKK